MCRQGSIWKPSSKCWPGNLSPQHKYRPKPFGRYFLRKKPSPGRGWQGAALTGVGRPAVPALSRPSSATCRSPFPQGNVKNKTLSWERVDRAKPGTGVGRYAEPCLYRPSSVSASPSHLPPGEGLFFILPTVPRFVSESNRRVPVSAASGRIPSGVSWAPPGGLPLGSPSPRG